VSIRVNGRLYARPMHPCFGTYDPFDEVCCLNCRRRYLCRAYTRQNVPRIIEEDRR